MTEKAAEERRRIDFKSLDRASIGLPFGRGAIVVGAPVRVAATAGPEAMEEARLAVQGGLDANVADDTDGWDPERAFERTQQQLVIIRLAHERLSDREQQVFFGIHFHGVTRAALSEDIGLTPQAIGQMYVRLVKSLYAAARLDPAFPGSGPEGGIT